MAEEDLLQRVSVQYKQYDRSANRWHWVHVNSRAAILLLGVLSVVGPTLKMALQADNPILAPLKPLDPYLGWVVLAVPALTAAVTVLAGMVNAPRVWIANRTGAETLKSEAFLYAAGAEKYATDRPDSVLRRRMLEIEQLVDDLQSAERAGG